MFTSVRTLVSLGAGVALMLALGVASTPVTATSPTLKCLRWLSACPLLPGWRRRLAFRQRVAMFASCLCGHSRDVPGGLAMQTGRRSYFPAKAVER